MTQQATRSRSGSTNAGHPDRLAPRLAAVTGTRITIIGADGIIQGDSREPSTIGRPVGEAWEVSRARRGEVGHAIRTCAATSRRSTWSRSGGISTG